MNEDTRKKGIDCLKAEFLTLEEGLCAQIMHIGPYDDEPATIAVPDDFIEESGYAVDIDLRLYGVDHPSAPTLQNSRSDRCS